MLMSDVLSPPVSGSTSTDRPVRYTSVLAGGRCWAPLGATASDSDRSKRGTGLFSTAACYMGTGLGRGAPITKSVVENKTVQQTLWTGTGTSGRRAAETVT